MRGGDDPVRGPQSCRRRRRGHQEVRHVELDVEVGDGGPFRFVVLFPDGFVVGACETAGPGWGDLGLRLEHLFQLVDVVAVERILRRDRRLVTGGG